MDGRETHWEERKGRHTTSHFPIKMCILPGRGLPVNRTGRKVCIARSQLRAI